MKSMKIKVITLTVSICLVLSVIFGGFILYINTSIFNTYIKQYETALFDNYDRSIKLQVEIASSMLDKTYGNVPGRQVHRKRSAKTGSRYTP